MTAIKQNVFSILADEKSHNLFRYMASNGGWFPGDLVSALRLSMKQFYSRMSALENHGLIVKRERKWYLTSFGRLVDDCLKRVEEAKPNLWAFKLIDENRENLTAEQLNKVCEALIADQDTRQLLLVAK